MPDKKTNYFGSTLDLVGDNKLEQGENTGQQIPNPDLGEKLLSMLPSKLPDTMPEQHADAIRFQERQAKAKESANRINKQFAEETQAQLIAGKQRQQQEIAKQENRELWLSDQVKNAAIQSIPEAMRGHAETEQKYVQMFLEKNLPIAQQQYADYKRKKYDLPNAQFNTLTGLDEYGSNRSLYNDYLRQDTQQAYEAANSEFGGLGGAVTTTLGIGGWLAGNRGEQGAKVLDEQVKGFAKGSDYRKEYLSQYLDEKGEPTLAAKQTVYEMTNGDRSQYRDAMQALLKMEFGDWDSKQTKKETDNQEFQNYLATHAAPVYYAYRWMKGVKQAAASTYATAKASAVSPFSDKTFGQIASEQKERIAQSDPGMNQPATADLNPVNELFAEVAQSIGHITGLGKTFGGSSTVANQSLSGLKEVTPALKKILSTPTASSMANMMDGVLGTARMFGADTYVGYYEDLKNKGYSDEEADVKASERTATNLVLMSAIQPLLAGKPRNQQEDLIKNIFSPKDIKAKDVILGYVKHGGEAGGVMMGLNLHDAIYSHSDAVEMGEASEPFDLSEAIKGSLHSGASGFLFGAAMQAINGHGTAMGSPQSRAISNAIHNRAEFQRQLDAAVEKGAMQPQEALFVNSFLNKIEFSYREGLNLRQGNAGKMRKLSPEQAVQYAIEKERLIEATQQLERYQQLPETEPKKLMQLQDKVIQSSKTFAQLKDGTYLSKKQIISGNEINAIADTYRPNPIAKIKSGEQQRKIRSEGPYTVSEVELKQFENDPEIQELRAVVGNPELAQAYKEQATILRAEAEAIESNYNPVVDGNTGITLIPKKEMSEADAARLKEINEALEKLKEDSPIFSKHEDAIGFAPTEGSPAIVIGKNGKIIDGRKRVAVALNEGRTTIEAARPISEKENDAILNEEGRLEPNYEGLSEENVNLLRLAAEAYQVGTDVQAVERERQEELAKLEEPLFPLSEDNDWGRNLSEEHQRIKDEYEKAKTDINAKYDEKATSGNHSSGYRAAAKLLLEQGVDKNTLRSLLRRLGNAPKPSVDRVIADESLQKEVEPSDADIAKEHLTKDEFKKYQELLADDSVEAELNARELVLLAKERAEETPKQSELKTALEHEVYDPSDRVLQYFIAGGKIHPSAIQEIYGKGERGDKITEQKQAFLWAVKNDAPTLKELAHQMWEGMPEGENRFTDQDFREAIESALGGFGSPTEMAKDLNRRWNEKNASEAEAEFAEFIGEGKRKEEPIATAEESIPEEWKIPVSNKDEETPFQKGVKKFKTISHKAYDALLTKLKKAFPEYAGDGKIITNEAQLREALKRNGLSWEDFNGGLMAGTDFAKKLNEVNEKFNRELEDLISNELPDDHIFQLGNPGAILKASGIPDLPIELTAKKLSEKAAQKEHPFELTNVKDLSKAVQNPIAVFESSTVEGRKVIFTELQQQGKSFVVALELNFDKGKLLVNDVRSLYPRNNTQIVRSISKGEARYINKEKALEWIGRQQFNSAEATKISNAATNIIQEFENPISDKDVEQAQFQIRYDRSGNQIGDGSWNVEPFIINLDEYPQVRYDISNSETTESSYVTYTNTQNGESIKVRFSNHENNAVKFGDQLDGYHTNPNEILHRIGLKDRIFIPETTLSIGAYQVKRKNVKDYEVADKTIQEIYALPIGTDLTPYKGKVAKNSNWVIGGDVVKEIPVTKRDVFGNSRQVGTYEYKDVKYFHTPKGGIYGALLPDGTMYLNPEAINANTPIHEFGHVWERMLPNHFGKGVELLKQSTAGKKIIAELKEGGQYGTDENKIAREALVQAIGDKGEKLYNGKIPAKIKQWISDLWAMLSDKLGIKVDADTAFDRFVAEAAKDILGGKEIISENITFTQDGKATKIPHRSAQTQLRGGEEIHSEKQKIKNRLEQGIAEAEREFKRPLTTHEIEDVYVVDDIVTKTQAETQFQRIPREQFIEKYKSKGFTQKEAEEAANEIYGVKRQAVQERSETTEQTSPKRTFEQNSSAKSKPTYARIQVAPIQNTGEAKKLNTILSEANKGTGGDIIYGKIGSRRTLGAYKPGDTGIIIRYQGDLDTTAHELGHKIDDKFKVLETVNSQVDWELSFYSPHGSKPPAGHPDPLKYERAEGFAEFLRALIVNPDAAKQTTPELYKLYETKVSPEMRSEIERFSNDVRTWAGTSNLERTLSNIQTEPQKKPNVLTTLFKKAEEGKLSFNWADKLKVNFTNPFQIFNKSNKYLNGLNGIDKQLPQDDPTLLARLLLGVDGKISSMLEHGMTNSKGELLLDKSGKEKNIEWLLDTFDATDVGTIEREKKLTMAYMVAQRTVELSGRFNREELLTGIGGGVFSDLATAKRALEEIDNLPNDQRIRIEEAANRYREFADDILQYMVDKGRLSKELYNQIKKDNIQYVALQRIAESEPGTEVEVYKPSGGKNLGSTSNPINTIKGSTKTIQDPYASLFDTLYKSVRESDRNEVLSVFRNGLKSARDMHGADYKALAEIGQEVNQGTKETVTIFVNGKAEYWKFHPDIYKMLKGLDGELYRLPKIATALPAALRGAVTNFPVFAMRNIVRDTQDRMIKSNSNNPENWYGLKDFTADTKYWREIERTGGLNAGYYLRDYNSYYGLQREATHKLAKNKNIKLLDPERLKSGWKGYQNLLQKGETANRVAEYKAAFRKAKAEGLDDYNARLKAAYQARDLVDFAVMGHQMQWINQLVPFSNAHIQGLRSTFARAKENPMGFAIRLAMLSVVPAMIEWILNNQDDESKERYNELPSWQRDMFTNIHLGDNTWASIPKPFEISLFGAGLNRTLSATLGGDERAFAGYGGSVVQSLSPLDEGAMFGPYQSIIETMVNYDNFRDKHIVPVYEENLSLDLRNTEYASRLGKALQEVAGMDARKADFFIKSQFSYFGNAAMKLSDIGREGKSFNISDIGFFKEDPGYSSKSVQEYMTKAKEYGLLSSRGYKEFNRLKDEYFNAKNDTEKAQAAFALREYARIEAATLDYLGEAKKLKKKEENEDE